MWEVYWDTVRTSGIDWFILSWGVLLIFAHLLCLALRLRGTSTAFVQQLDRYRTVLLAFTELLPVMGLAGTVLSLMATFKYFQTAPGGGAPDFAEVVRTFAPALSATFSGLLMIGPNLVLNTFLWLACPLPEKAEEKEPA